MDDVFIEKIVPRKKSGIDYLKIVGIILAYFVILFLIFVFAIQYVAFLVPLLIFGGAWLVYMVITNLNIEHEYIVTNGDIDIDVIHAQRKRKRLFSGKAKDFEICAKVNSDEYKSFSNNKSLKVLDATSNTGDRNTWFFVSHSKGQRMLVLFEPNKRMMDGMLRYNPSRIKYNPTVDSFE